MPHTPDFENNVLRYFRFDTCSKIPTLYRFKYILYEHIIDIIIEELSY